MKRAFSLVLMSLGGLFLAAAVAAGVLLALGKPPRERLQAAVAALQGKEMGKAPADAQAPPASASSAAPVDAGLIEEARLALEEDRERFRQEKGMAHAQLEAEAVEVGRLKDEVAQRVEEAKHPPAPAASAPSGSVAQAPATASDKGAKALAEIAAKMTPKAAAQLLGQESEEAVAGVLKRMDPKQAAKVLGEMVATDPERAQRVAGILREGKKS